MTMDWLYEAIYKGALLGIGWGVLITLYKLISKLFASNVKSNKNESNSIKSDVSENNSVTETENQKITEEQNKKETTVAEASSFVDMLIGAAVVASSIMLGMILLDKLGKWLY